MTNIRRCDWCAGDPLTIAYHDTDWGTPIHDGRMLWEALVIDGFQAGLSWRTILHKRGAFRAAFRNFDPEIVARFDEQDIARLMADASIVRNEAKIRAAIGNARAYLDMASRGEHFSAFVWAFVDGKPTEGGGTRLVQSPESERISNELKKRGFKFTGPVTVYAWMQAVGMVNDHQPDCFRRGEVRARATG